MKKILIASDHGGFSLKQKFLTDKNHFNDIEFIDLGVTDEKSVDYPDYAQILCKKILDGEPRHEILKGILICGSGQGMAIQANRFKGIRAALCWSVETAKLSREHNNANVLCLGARLFSPELAFEIAHFWLATPFEGGRHLERIKKLDTTSFS